MGGVGWFRSRIELRVERVERGRWMVVQVAFQGCFTFGPEIVRTRTLRCCICTLGASEQEFT